MFIFTRVLCIAYQFSCTINHVVWVIKSVFNLLIQSSRPAARVWILPLCCGPHNWSLVGDQWVWRLFCPLCWHQCPAVSFSPFPRGIGALQWPQVMGLKGIRGSCYSCVKLSTSGDQRRCSETCRENNTSWCKWSLREGDGVDRCGVGQRWRGQHPTAGPCIWG